MGNSKVNEQSAVALVFITPQCQNINKQFKCIPFLNFHAIINLMPLTNHGHALVTEEQKVQ